MDSCESNAVLTLHFEEAKKKRKFKYKGVCIYELVFKQMLIFKTKAF